ncbi:MAG: tRNA (adenosine(37)-N6)-threonylcarbamoyltransferase complex ATPase subunit type 1 TsaE [Leptospirales bacterium]
MADSFLLPPGFSTGDAGGVLASLLPVGSLVILEGPTGIGKTEFVRGFARALGVSEVVTSPTFVTLQEYEGTNGSMFHGDLDRLPEGGGADFVEALLASREWSWSLVEWGGKLSPSLWGAFLVVIGLRFSWESEEGRLMTVRCLGGGNGTGEGEPLVTLFLDRLIAGSGFPAISTGG